MLFKRFRLFTLLTLVTALALLALLALRRGDHQRPKVQAPRPPPPLPREKAVARSCGEVHELEQFLNCAAQHSWRGTSSADVDELMRLAAERIGAPTSFVDSYGLVLEPERNWCHRKARYLRQAAQQKNTNQTTGQAFFQENWEPNFSCALEERLGRYGDGGKWVCDVHSLHLRPQLFRSLGHSQYRCVVYSFGSNNDFSFEERLHERLPHCQIFVFDATSSPPDPPRDYIQYYSRMLRAAESSDSLGDIVTDLNHWEQPVNLEVLKVDIEHGEYDALLGAFDIAKLIRTGHKKLSELNDEESRALLTWRALRRARQVLIELHFLENATESGHAFFEGMDEAGFVIFHKEPNIQYTGGTFVEYAFLRLEDSFFRDEHGRHLGETIRHGGSASLPHPCKAQEGRRPAG
ncbi:hypothetical protein CDCA_CDCA17G4344 [Cyanidium caldarium]|uniref:Methyltransferase domain-containing protein n=1 Tax=Cyanidium caldarium TaxID=2771 RepID=A0AAV9J1E7_CYACA|nr:hypothetical protein CDCA_CDCA17G4344 [Cyanidium caldarium]